MRQRSGRPGAMPSCLRRALVWWDFSYGLRSVLGRPLMLTPENGVTLSREGLVIDAADEHVWVSWPSDLKRYGNVTVVAVVRPTGPYINSGNSSITCIQYAVPHDAPYVSLGVVADANTPAHIQGYWATVGITDQAALPWLTWDTGTPLLAAMCYTSATGKSVTSCTGTYSEVANSGSGGIAYSGTSIFTVGDATASSRNVQGVHYAAGFIHGLVTEPELVALLRFCSAGRRIYR